MKMVTEMKLSQQDRALLKRITKALETVAESLATQERTKRLSEPAEDTDLKTRGIEKGTYASGGYTGTGNAMPTPDKGCYIPGFTDEQLKILNDPDWEAYPYNT